MIHRDLLRGDIQLIINVRSDFMSCLLVGVVERCGFRECGFLYSVVGL